MQQTKIQIGEGLKKELQAGFCIERISHWAAKMSRESRGDIDDEIEKVLESLCLMEMGPEFEYTEEKLKMLSELLINEEKDRIDIIDCMPRDVGKNDFDDDTCYDDIDISRLNKVKLDFRVNEDELSNSLNKNLQEPEDSVFISSIFSMPLRMKICNLELFKLKKVWQSGPIIGFASEGVATIKKLKISGKEHYGIIKGPGDLFFTMLTDEIVRVEFLGLSGKFDVIVGYEDLLKAFLKFANKVRKFLRERAPQINDHPYWGPWLRGEKD